MFLKKNLFPCCVALALLSAPALAQDAEQSLPTPSRILSSIDESRLVQLRGDIHPLARAEFDKGVVAETLPMERMMLILRRSPEQEKALEAFMAEQQDPNSANFHHWLTPQEFGAKYGPSNEDIQSITSWLSSHGFAIDQVSNGRVFIQFSGTASQVQQAFHTEIHRLLVRGEEHIANLRDPQIPEALAPVVVGVRSLHDFFAQPQHISGIDVHRDSANGQWKAVPDASRPAPLFASNNGGNISEYVSPYDFATLYNVTPLWNAGVDGTGQTIAIAGRSDISLTDVANFRKAFGLPAKAPTIIVNGKDPGVPTAGDKVENTLDVEWSGAVAKGATVKFVTSASTKTSDGAELSAAYIIDHKVAPVMSYSYGECELGLGKTGNASSNSLWQQGAAEGIAIFVASGDQGSAVCDGGQQPPYAAGFGLSVNGLSSTPYNVSVGGTDLNWGGKGSTYWNTTNAANGSSVKRYIPEVPWNDTCASDIIDAILGVTGEEATCNAVIGTQDEFLIQVVGGSGGKSACTTPSSNTVASCSGGYAKPSWQTGTGVPADGKRDLPDVSLFAADGLVGSAYLICDSASTPCTYSNPTDAQLQTVGGTSVASPAFAGIMALINQKAGTPQGFPDPGFYKLYAKENLAACKSNTVAATNSCVFYDITTSNNKVPCQPGSPNCVTSTSGDQVGVTSGYATTAGYDLAIGLGSVNVANLVNGWSSLSPKPVASITPTSLTFASTVVGITTAAQTITLKNTGNAAMTISSIAISGTNASSFLKSTSTCGATLAAAASCTVKVEFKPAAAGALTATLKFTDNAAGSPQSVTLKGTGLAKPTVTLSATKLTYAATTVGTATKAQVVTLKNTSTTSPLAITSIVLTGTSYSKTTTCGTTLAHGASCTVSVAFKPTAKGTLTGTLTFTDDATTAKQTVSLTGTGK